MSLIVHAVSGGRTVDNPKPTTLFLRGWNETYTSALLMFVIMGGESPIVVDTGPSNSELTARNHGYKLLQTPEEEPLAALRGVGVDPAEVKIVINTHLHWDHCWNNREFPNAKFIVQRAELEYAVNPLEWHRPGFEVMPGLTPPWADVWSRIETIEGDTEIAPGVSTVFLPGHTPGTQGVLVQTDGGPHLIASDCVPLYENWDGDERASHIPNGLYYDLASYAESFKKIEKLDCELIPSHDLAVLDKGPFA